MGNGPRAWRSLLLVIAGALGVIAVASALGAAATESDSHLNKRRAYRVIALGVLLVSIPLFVASVRVYRNSIAQTKITTITNQWVREYSTDIVVRSVLVSGGGAKILITGPERPSSIDDLGAKIKSEVEHVAEVDLRYVRPQDFQYC